MQPLNVWLVGDIDDPCFAPAVEWLEVQTSVHRFGSLAAALDGLRTSSSAPEFLMIFASRPGRVDPGVVAAFGRREPLTRMVQLLGSWCEGEVRTGRPIAGVKRLYWHQWRSQLPLALGLIAANSAEVNVPRTASESDWLEATLPQRSHNRHDFLIAVVTHRAATFDALADALTAGGFQSVWQRPSAPLEVSDVAAILCDGWRSQLESTDTGDQPRLNKVLLLDFPRLEDQKQAQAAGYFAIVSRPFLLPELWTTLDAAIAESASGTKLPVAHCDLIDRGPITNA